MTARTASPAASVLLVLAFAAAFLAVGSTTPCAACSCRAMGLSQYLEGADAVFVGRVTDRTEPPLAADGTRASTDLVRYAVHVTSVLKGTVPDRTTVLSEFSEASCGVEFRLGTEYLIFARGAADGEAYAGRCGGTSPTPGPLAVLEKLTGPGQPPAVVAPRVAAPAPGLPEVRRGGSPIGPLALAGGLMGGAVALVVVVLRRRRHGR